MNTIVDPLSPAGQTETASLSVFYDGSCPMCRREIDFYKRRRGAHQINWVDVSEATDNVAPNLSCEAAMARFHVQTADGEVIDGGAAFAALWRELPAFRWLGHLFSVQPLKWILNKAYDLFLPLRPRIQSALFGQRSSEEPPNPKSA